jgi:hypothetical protein
MTALPGAISGGGYCTPVDVLTTEKRSFELRHFDEPAQLHGGIS